MFRSVRNLVGGAVLGTALLALPTTSVAVSYVDPNASDPSVSVLFTGSALMDPVPGISVGDVYVDYWAFTHSGDAGYFYAYRLRNVSGANVAGVAAKLTYFDIINLAPFTDLGDGGGMGAGAAFVPWMFIGDGSLGDAAWLGNAGSSYVKQGSTSPSAPDAAPMFEIHSSYAPGAGTVWQTTVSGGGYTGQNIGVYVPVVPEPATVAGLVTGLLGLGGIVRRRRK